MILLLLCLTSLIGFPVLAYKGVGYRGLYFAGSLAALVFGLLAIAMSNGSPSDDSPAQIAGAEFMRNYFPALGGVLLVTAFAALVAGIMFRRAASSRVDG